jgi:hypothetical protein
VAHNTTSASAGGILNHGGTLILNASKVDDNTAPVAVAQAAQICCRTFSGGLL